MEIQLSKRSIKLTTPQNEQLFFHHSGTAYHVDLEEKTFRISDLQISGYFRTKILQAMSSYKSKDIQYNRKTWNVSYWDVEEMYLTPEHPPVQKTITIISPSTECVEEPTFAPSELEIFNAFEERGTGLCVLVGIHRGNFAEISFYPGTDRVYTHYSNIDARFFRDDIELINLGNMDVFEKVEIDEVDLPEDNKLFYQTTRNGYENRGLIPSYLDSRTPSLYPYHSHRAAGEVDQCLQIITANLEWSEERVEKLKAVKEKLEQVIANRSGDQDDQDQIQHA